LKHAGDTARDQLESVLGALRKRTELTERGRGRFYRKSSAFLHFHEDPEGLFADLKIGGAWHRFRVSTAAERKRLLAKLRETLAA
jgi:hypothetical protein